MVTTHRLYIMNMNGPPVLAKRAYPYLAVSSPLAGVKDLKESLIIR